MLLLSSLGASGSVMSRSTWSRDELEEVLLSFPPEDLRLKPMMIVKVSEVDVGRLNWSQVYAN